MMYVHVKSPGRQGSFTPSDYVTNVTLMGRMGYIPILPVTQPIKKIKGVVCQCYGDRDGVVWCERTFNVMSSADTWEEMNCDKK